MLPWITLIHRLFHAEFWTLFWTLKNRYPCCCSDQEYLEQWMLTLQIKMPVLTCRTCCLLLPFCTWSWIQCWFVFRLFFKFGSHLIFPLPVLFAFSSLPVAMVSAYLNAPLFQHCHWRYRLLKHPVHCIFWVGRSTIGSG